jgi:hypothetical protein
MRNTNVIRDPSIAENADRVASSSLFQLPVCDWTGLREPPFGSAIYSSFAFCRFQEAVRLPHSAGFHSRYTRQSSRTHHANRGDSYRTVWLIGNSREEPSKSFDANIHYKA